MDHAAFNRLPLPRNVKTTPKWRKRFAMMIGIPSAVIAIAVAGISALAKDATPEKVALGALCLFCFNVLMFLALGLKVDYLGPVRLFRKGQMTEGRVTRQGGSRNPYITVDFSDAHGKKHTAKISLGILESRYDTGARVDVIYDPASPCIAIIPRNDYFEFGG